MIPCHRYRQLTSRDLVFKRDPKAERRFMPVVESCDGPKY